MSATPLSPAEWHRRLADLPQAAFCHTPGWARTVREVWGGDTGAVLQPTPDGQAALLPLVSRRLAGGRLPWTVSGETGVYGGPLRKEPMPANAWQDLWRDLGREHGSMTLFLPPGTAWTPPRRGQGLARLTHRLDLTAGDPARRYHRSLKGRLNRARRLGVTVEAASSQADVEAFVGLYADTLRRWGERTSWPRPAAYYQALFHHGQPYVRLWLAKLDGRPIAGLWMATYGGEAHQLHTATSTEGLQTAGAHLLIDHAMGVAGADGYRVYDFGPSGDRPGLVAFKESFGAAPVPYGEVRLWAPAVRLYWFIKDSLRQPQAPAGSAEAPC